MQRIESYINENYIFNFFVYNLRLVIISRDFPGRYREIISHPNGKREGKCCSRSVPGKKFHSQTLSRDDFHFPDFSGTTYNINPYI